MKYRAIISEAWAITQNNKKLIWIYAFLPSLLTTLVSMGYVSYQAAAFWTSEYIHPDIPSSQHPINVLIHLLTTGFQNNGGLMVFLLIFLALGLLAYLLVPVFMQGALIQVLARKRAGQDVSIPQGITFGFTRFLPLLEYHLAIKTFSFFGLLGEASFAFRNLGPDVFSFLGWIFLLAIIVGLLVSLLFTYSEYYLVIDREGVFGSMIKSSGLVVRQWHHTLFMFFLMGVIVARMLINILVALLIPLLVVGPIFFFTNATFATVGAVIGAILGLVALYFASYFVGVFHVFTTGVWTFTFLDLTDAEKNDIDLHEAAVHHEE